MRLEEEEMLRKRQRDQAQRDEAMARERQKDIDGGTLGVDKKFKQLEYLLNQSKVPAFSISNLRRNLSSFSL